MLLKTEIYHIKTIASLLFISVLSTSYLHAQVIDCNAAQPASIKKSVIAILKAYVMI